MNEKEILALIDNKEYVKAQALLVDYLMENPQDTEMHKLLGLCNINLECFDQALASFEFVMKMNPEDALSKYYAANVYIEKNELKKAQKCLKEVINLRPDYLDAYKSLAVVYLKLKDYDEVFKLGSKILNEDASDVQIYDILAAAAMENAGFDLAVDYLKRAVDIDNKNTKYITKLGIAYFAAGKVSDAIETYKKSLAIEPNDGQTLYNMGLAYYAFEEYKTAYDYLKQAYDNGFEASLSAYALAAYKACLYKEGIELYTKLIEQFPDKENYQYNLACCYDGNNDPVTASTLIERLLTFNLESVQLKLHLASLYSRLGRCEAAKILYSDVIDMGFLDTNIMYEYAVLCAKTNDTDRAEEVLNEIIQRDPSYAYAYKDLAIIYTSRRLFDIAEDYFKKAKKADPKNIYVLFEIANYYHLMSDFENAKKTYSKLLKFDNVPDYMLVSTAKNLISMNMPKKAKKILFEALQKNVSNTDAMFYLSQVLMTEKDYQNAKQLLETAYTISPGVEFANMLAKVYTEIGEYDKAYNLYKVASVVAPNSITLLLAMADCKCRQKEYSTALEHLTPVLEMFPEHEEALEILEKIKKGE